MKKLLWLGGCCLWLSAASAEAPAADRMPAVPPHYGRIAMRVAKLLPKAHVLQHPFDDEISRQAWTNLITYYDFDRSVFLKSDLDELARRDRRLDDELLAGDVSFGFDVHRLYLQRLHERIDYATNLLAKGEWDFSTDEKYRIRRKDAEWPEDAAAAREQWRRRMKNEVLATTITRELDGATNKVDVAQDLIKKYRQYALVMAEPDEEAILQQYLSAVSRAYDPHTDYMSPASKEDFDMEMNLSLCGVGAVLTMEDGALKISEVMSGGPMARDGRIHEGDKITGVRQEDGELEDIMWQPMRKSIKKIRGRKGTKVTLEIIPRSDPSGLTRKLIELVRDEIKLEDQAATGHVERVVLDGVTNCFGYVYLPGFYGTMDKRPSDPGFRSAAQDVNGLIADFNADGAKGMVLDLRGNGGGSLMEAIRMSALFVRSGPVVQVRDLRNVNPLPIMPGNPVAFRKPLVVLIDRASASASEIVAAHLQDVDRAIVVGDVRSHGKGTVQTVLGLGPDKYGSMKITTARFYRVNGNSTQIEGVASDIHLPSLLDSLDIGEDKLPNALPFSRILPADYALSWNLHDYLPELKSRSAARLAKDVKYRKHLENVRGMKELSDREYVPLEYSARKAMMAADRNLHELDGDDDAEDAGGKRRNRHGAKDDVVLEEAYRILADLVRLNGGATLPQPKGWW